VEGLQHATAGSPLLPPDFTYYDKKETSGSGWSADLRTDVGFFSMPQAGSVAPRDPGFFYYLSTWANVTPVVAGHWIVLTGWDGAWDGTEAPTVNYDDSAVGAKGTASYQSAYDMWEIINHANSQHSAGYVVY
jgi:hypothetical protein